MTAQVSLKKKKKACKDFHISLTVPVEQWKAENLFKDINKVLLAVFKIRGVGGEQKLSLQSVSCNESEPIIQLVFS